MEERTKLHTVAEIPCVGDRKGRGIRGWERLLETHGALIGHHPATLLCLRSGPWEGSMVGPV
jgi:hypothetical protein